MSVRRAALERDVSQLESRIALLGKAINEMQQNATASKVHSMSAQKPASQHDSHHEATAARTGAARATTGRPSTSDGHSRLSLVVSAELHDRVCRMALARRCAVNKIIRDALEREVARRD